MNTLVKIAVTIIISVLASNIQAQTNFEKGMTKAFALWEEGKWDEAENMFERIAKAEDEQWLPNYYIAQINSLKSWNEKDEAILKAQLDKAQEHLDIALTKTEDNAELLIMQAQVLTNWVAFDGMKYGMKYGQKVSELYTKALKLDPKNPRAKFCKAEWDMGSAKYFGKDTEPYCEDIEASIELFDTFKAESEFHPNWGKERAEQVADECKK
ncbi:hypothetical protein [Winogradskyella sp.]|uniref:hypothetical protein n=1 Tax=Winogradskyella sp. TaxID=1883156 RepID=UPI003518804C